MPTRGQSDRTAGGTLAAGLAALASLAQAMANATQPKLLVGSEVARPIQPLDLQESYGRVELVTIGTVAGAGPRRGSIALSGAGAVLPGLRSRQSPPGPRRPGDATTPPVDKTDVVELVAAAQAGDAEAFGALYDRYFDLVFRYVYYRAGSPQLTEDLVSETFLRALRRLGRFSWQGKDFGAWLVTIARNLLTDHFKSSRYRLEVATADMLDADRVEDGPENAVLQSLTNAALIDAVRRLGAEQQECVMLRFLHGLSVAETAQIMGRGTGAIKALQYRAVRALAKTLPADIR